MLVLLLMCMLDRRSSALSDVICVGLITLQSKDKQRQMEVLTRATVA